MSNSVVQTPIVPRADDYRRTVQELHAALGEKGRLKDEVKELRGRAERREQLEQAVRKMRTLQVQWFKHRNPNVLAECKKIEREVDRLLNELDVQTTAKRQPRLL